MTELIPSRRYRWTVEGIFDGGILILEDAHIPGDLLRRYGVFEVLPDPLPTALGSVVRGSDAYDYSLRLDGWYCVATNSRFSTDLLQADNFHVRFDAGAK